MGVQSSTCAISLASTSVWTATEWDAAMLKHIEITGYKSLVDVQVDLQPLVVLFGPNGAGKSNFLDALQLLSRMAISPTLKAVERQIREMKRPAEERPKADSASNGSSLIRETFLRYRVEVEILPGSGILRVTDEYAAALNAKGEPTGKRRAFLERVGQRIHLR